MESQKKTNYILAENQIEKWHFETISKNGTSFTFQKWFKYYTSKQRIFDLISKWWGRFDSCLDIY